MKKFLTCKNIMLCCILFCLFTFFCCFWGDISIYDIDDINSTIDSYHIWKEENGRFVFNFLSRVFCLYIPNFLNIHVQNAISSIGVGMYALIQLLLFSTISCFYLIKGKNTFVYIVMLLFATAIFYFDYVMSGGISYGSIVSFQYGYVFATAVTLAFLLYIYRYVLTGKLVKTKYLPLLCVLGFCAGNSTQFMCYSAAVVIILLFFSYIVKRKFNVKKIKFLFRQKRIFYPILAFFIGLTAMVACPGFWHEVAWRHASSFQEIKDIFIPFFESYYQVVIIAQIKYLFIISILIVLILITSFLKKQSMSKKLNESIVVCFPIVGALCYFVTLILAGKTFPSEKLLFWVYEPFYTFCWLMILSSVICLLFGILFFEIKNKFIKVFLSVIFILYLFYGCFPYNEDSYADAKNELKSFRLTSYENEKMILYYVYNGIDNIKMIKLDIDMNRYIKKIHGIEVLNEIEMTEKNQALEYYYSLGGIFSDEELEKLDFQKLYDKDFILNKKEGDK